MVDDACAATRLMARFAADCGRTGVAEDPATSCWSSRWARGVREPPQIPPPTFPRRSPSTAPIAPYDSPRPPRASPRSLAPLRSPPREPPPPPRRWTLARVPLPALDGTWPTTTRAPHPPPTSPSPPPRSRAPCPTPPDCISVRTTTWTASLEATPPRGRGVPAAQPWSFRRGCPTGDA